MSAARLIVCEAAHDWSAALTWALRGSHIRVCRASDFEAGWRLLASHPTSVLVLELRAPLAETLGEHLLEFRCRFPRAMLITAGQDKSALWSTRQLGAAHTLVSTRNLAPTVRMIERHFEAEPEESATMRELVWQRMPWATDPLE